MPRTPLYPGITMPETMLPPEQKLSEMRGKLNLKEADGGVFVEETKANVVYNEKAIVTLRTQNMQKRVALADGINNDTNVIRTVFEENIKKENLSSLRLTMDKVLEAMNKKIGEGTNRLNALGYESAKKEHQLHELEDQLLRLLTLEAVDIDSEEQKAFRKLENDLDKSRVKNDAAKNIGRRYIKILEHLKSECYLYPGKLDRMEKQIKEAAVEIEDAEIMKVKAVRTCEVSQVDMYNKERQIIQSKIARDREVNEARNEAEHQQELLEIIDKKPHGSTQVAAEPETDSPSEFITRKELILGLEDCFDKLKRAIDVGDITDVMSHVTRQQKVKENMLLSKDTILHNILKLQRELDLQIAIHEDIKFSNTKAKLQAQKHVYDMSEFTQSEEERRDKALKILEEKEKLKAQLDAGINTLYEKLKEIKLKLPMFNYKKGNSLEDLQTCEKKLVVLMDMIQSESQSYKLPEDQSHLQEFMETCLPQENIRIKFAMNELDEEVFMFDHEQDNVDLLNRDEIKRRAWELTNPKKKKAAKSTKTA